MWPDIYARTPETEFIVDFHREGFKKLLEHWDEIRAEMARQNDGELVTFQSYEMHSSLYGDHHIISPDDTFPLIYRDSPARLVADCAGLAARGLGIDPDLCASVGVGCPGIANRETGEVVYSGPMVWNHVPFGKELQKQFAGK